MADDFGALGLGECGFSSFSSVEVERVKQHGVKPLDWMGGMWGIDLHWKKLHENFSMGTGAVFYLGISCSKPF